MEIQHERHTGESSSVRVTDEDTGISAVGTRGGGGSYVTLHLPDATRNGGMEWSTFALGLMVTVARVVEELEGTA